VTLEKPCLRSLATSSAVSRWARAVCKRAAASVGPPDDVRVALGRTGDSQQIGDPSHDNAVTAYLGV